MCQILQKLPHRSTDKFERRYHGSGQKLKKTLLTVLQAALCSDSILRHYDPTAELVLQCDSSLVGVGAALLQPGPDGTLQPVAHASRILNNIIIQKKNYSHFEGESLTIVFGVTKFRQYLLGRHFKLLIDHKPLISSHSENKSLCERESKDGDYF